MEWSEDTIVRLRELWAEGHSTAEIGRKLGVSKNAIVGKAHRLDLAARPSPIRRGGGGNPAPRRPSPRRVDGPTLPPLISTVPLTVPAPAPAPIVLAPKPVAPPRVHAVPAPAPRPYGRIITCCWPIGEPGTRSFRFCDVGSVPGKPYCADHAQVAYVKIRDKREDAA